MEAGRRLVPAHGALTLKLRASPLSRRPERRLGLVEAIGQPAATVGRVSLVVAIPSHSHLVNLGSASAMRGSGVIRGECND